MNKELENELRYQFIEWRGQVAELEREYQKGIITYSEYIAKQKDLIDNCGEKLFSACFQLNSW